MHAVLSSLTAAFLGIHAIFGCCRHFAHDCERCTSAASQAAAVPDCCDHHEGCGEQDGEPGPCKCLLECHGVCTFLPSQKTLIDSPNLVVPLDFVAAGTTFSAVHPLAACEAARGPTAIGPPLRLHLLHQILLI